MADTVTRFEVGGRTYKLSALPLVESLKGQTILTGGLLTFASGGHAIMKGAIADGSFIRDLVIQLDRLPELVQLFAAHCQVNLLETAKKGAKDHWVPLDTFLDTCFARRNVDLLEWLLECVGWQYADFLAEGGLVSLGSRVAKRYPSLTSLIGGSGESPSTEE